jgi:UDP-N-acetylmuramyl pentapeptide phosphotransferase/UDP-N-acetylglucosamine-1-phosphate transferase
MSVLSVLLTFAAAAGLAGAISWAGPIDPPTARGAHRRPTPTSGGVAVMGAAGLGLLLWPAAGTNGWRLAATLALALVMGVIGALDDLFDIGAKTKLLLQAALALVFAAFVAHVEVLPLGLGLNLPLSPVVGIAGVALWIVVATNAVNFMDGANGVAPGAQVCLFIAMTVAAWGRSPLVAEVSIVAALACAGFLPWNLRGRLFQGDAGALFCGFLFAGLAILSTAPSAGSRGLSLYFGPLVLLPFLTDVLLTLAVRARRGQSLLQAHRDHLYQLWLRQDSQPSHAALAWRVMLIMAVYGGVGLVMLACPPRVQPEIFAAAVAFSALGWGLLRRRLEGRP